MSLTTISNGDTGLSVRNKLNTLIGESNSIVNIVDYGADPTGAVDSTTAIQNALNDAFGVYTSPLGQSSYAQRIVLFPNGEYLVSSPLYIVGVDGGMIIGNTTRILWAPTMAQNAIQPSGDTSAFGGTITPCFMFDGWKNSYIHGINIDGLGTFAQTNVSSCGFYLAQSGSHGTSTANIWENCGVAQVGGCGIIAGVTGNCDNCMLINVTFDTCNFSGLRLVSQNSVNWSSYNGGASHCASSTTYQTYAGGAQTAGNMGAAYSMPGGSCCIYNPSMSGNYVDVYTGGNQPCVIMGGSSEPNNGTTGSISSLVAVGSPMFVAHFACRPDTTFTGPFLDASYSGLIAAYNCSYAPGSAPSGGGVIASLGGGGTAIIDLLTGSSGGVGGKILGSSGSSVSFRDNIGFNSLFTSYTGQILEFTQSYPLLTVSTLPTASASWEKIVLYVTDSSSAWSSGSIGNTLTGGGSHTVPIRCPGGSSWVMAG